MRLQTQDSVSRLKGVGPAYSAALAAAGIHSVADLLLRFPVDYIDCRRVERDFVAGRPGLYSGRVLSLSMSRNFRRRLSTIRLELETPAGSLRALVFNQPWWLRQLERGKRIWVFGQVDPGEKPPTMTAPRIFLEPPEKVIPVYRSLEGISRGRLRRLIHTALEVTDPPSEILPPWILEKRGWPGWLKGLERIHLAVDGQDKLARSLDRFRYTEFLAFHLELRLVRQLLGNIKRRYAYQCPAGFKAELESRLGFTLTAGQAGALSEILADLEGPTAMQRLVQGDVGSGKTAVALAALWLAASNGFQSAFLAPTDLLARQHAQLARRVLKKTPVKLLTGSTPASQRHEIEACICRGETLVVFGTHALLNRSLTFPRLAMVVIDEQQRFGVSQRAALYGKGRGADLLVTTATPIPRTLMLALFHDLAVSTIRDRPRGRERVRTKVLDARRRDAFYSWLVERWQGAGKTAETPERVFIVLPRIRPTEPAPEVASLEIEGRALRQRLNAHGAALLSGETPAAERERLLKDFRAGRLRVLIATTVVELGIDVPEATIMVIENADRFGLAQLHQLRGRVGRGERPGQCYLIRSPGASQRGRQRLQIMVREDDGFRLAEKDLEMRGGGEVAGQRQAGNLDFRFGDPARDHGVFLQAREDAQRILNATDPATPWLDSLIASIRERIGQIHFS